MLFLRLVIALGVCSHLAFSEHGFPSSWEEFEFQYGRSLESLFRDYRTVFEKKYANKNSEAAHFATFSTRVKDVFDFNGAKHSWQKGINRFTDLSDEERKAFVMPEVDAKVCKTNNFHFEFYN